ncbi:MAG: MAPEG family protein [Rhodobacter sp.]|nr:MAPEG family protein [Rhodobacter sp.]
MTLPITTLFALPLVAIWAALWMGVSASRGQLNCSIGDGGNPELLLKIRRHGNFIEWVPFTLLLMILAEAQGTSAPWLYAAGGLLLLGRVAHPFGLKIDNVNHPLRYLGNGPCFLAVAVLFFALARITFGL